MGGQGVDDEGGGSVLARSGNRTGGCGGPSAGGGVVADRVSGGGKRCDRACSAMVDLSSILMSGAGAKVPVGALGTPLGGLESDGLGGVGFKVLRNE
jgi:hypothetical protein